MYTKIIDDHHCGFQRKRSTTDHIFEIVGGLRKLQNEELHYLYSLPSIIKIITSRMMNWAGHAPNLREKKNTYRILVGKPEGKRTLEISRPKWEDNIKMDLRGRGWSGMD
jgi:hypothetical protein